MRVQLARCGLAALVVAVLSATATAQPEDDRRGSAGLRIYTDDDDMTVVSPSAGAQTPVGASVVVDVNTTADVISGASVDVVSEASPTAISETRVELGLGASWGVARTITLRSRAIGSYEPDYLSVRAQGGVTLELAERNATLDLEYTGGVDSVGSVVDDEFSESRSIHRGVVTFTHVLDTRTYADVAVDLQRMSGFHASPYRTVPIVDPLTPVILRVPEVTPRVRAAVAARVGVRRAFGANNRWFGHADYRVYRDDWSIASHTVSLSSIRSWRRGRFQLGVRLRGYVQSAAEFYAPHYELDGDGGAPELRTRERRLSRMRTLFGGVTADWQLGSGQSDERPHVVIAVGGMRMAWPDFPAQDRRNAMMVTALVDAPL